MTVFDVNGHPFVSRTFEHHVLDEVLLSDVYQKEAQVKPGDVVVDAGAHIGSFCVKVADIAGKVIAFEPEQDNFQLLQNNTGFYRNVETHQKALWSSTGRMTLYHDRSHTESHSLFPLPHGVSNYTVDVEVVKLDDAVEGPVDFIKMDIEGAEIEALRGASWILKTHHPVIAMEAHPIAPLERWWLDLLSVLEPHGYVLKGFKFDENIWCRKIVTAMKI